MCLRACQLHLRWLPLPTDANRHTNGFNTDNYTDTDLKFDVAVAENSAYDSSIFVYEIAQNIFFKVSPKH